MPDTPAPSPVSPAFDSTHRPGTLVLVVGPSGAGKDTLIDAARAHFGGTEEVVFCTRFITRASQTGEQHTPLSVSEFVARREAGGFMLAWVAYGLHYGIATGALEALRQGKTVVANVSRMVIAEARRIWPHTLAVQITARPEVRQARLGARNRERPEAVALRLQRGDDIALPPADWLREIDNSGSLADATARFIAILAEAVSAPTGSAPPV